MLGRFPFPMMAALAAIGSIGHINHSANAELLEDDRRSRRSTGEFYNPPSRRGSTLNEEQKARRKKLRKISQASKKRNRH